MAIHIKEVAGIKLNQLFRVKPETHNSPGMSASLRTVGCPPVAMRMWGAVYFLPSTSTVGSGSFVNLAWPWMFWTLALKGFRCHYFFCIHFLEQHKLKQMLLNILTYTNLLCRGCCDKCDLSDWYKRLFWPLELCKHRKWSKIRGCLFVNPHSSKKKTCIQVVNARQTLFKNHNWLQIHTKTYTNKCRERSAFHNHFTRLNSSSSKIHTHPKRECGCTSVNKLL